MLGIFGLFILVAVPIFYIIGKIFGMENDDAIERILRGFIISAAICLMIALAYVMIILPKG